MVIAESKAAMGTVVNQAEIIFLKSKMLKNCIPFRRKYT
jgi:hypothetical protein